MNSSTFTDQLPGKLNMGTGGLHAPSYWYDTTHKYRICNSIQTIQRTLWASNVPHGFARTTCPEKTDGRWKATMGHDTTRYLLYLVRRQFGEPTRESPKGRKRKHRLRDGMPAWLALGKKDGCMRAGTRRCPSASSNERENGDEMQNYVLHGHLPDKGAGTIRRDIERIVLHAVLHVYWYSCLLHTTSASVTVGWITKATTRESSYPILSIATSW